MAMRTQVDILTLKTHDPFTIGRSNDGGSSDDLWKSVIVQVEDQGIVARGEAAPRSYFDETPEKTHRLISEWLKGRETLEDAKPEDLEDLGRESLAARAALDLCLHDLAAQRVDLPLWSYLGERYKLKLPDGGTALSRSSLTIALAEPEVMAARAAKVADWPVLKLKLGAHKVRRTLKLIREVTSTELRIDANTAWTADRTLRLDPHLRRRGVVLVEQPLPSSDHEGYRKLSKADTLPIWIDEGVRNQMDFETVAPMVAGINLKLSKNGGLAACAHLIREARKRNLGVMLGCFIESSIGVTAAGHLAMYVDHADLDGSTLISNDPFEGMTLDKGRVTLPTGSGTGVTRRSASDAT